jgi:hypothetical protein
VGIGEPSRAAVDHVLSRFTSDERRIVNEVLDSAADAVEDWARLGAPRAANKWNSWSPDTRAAEERPASGVARTPDAIDPTIVRTPTGWRRLLPRAGRGS